MKLPAMAPMERVAITRSPRMMAATRSLRS